MQKDRFLYLDILRIMATFAVVLIHVVATNWYRSPLDSAMWITCNIAESMIRWAVPVFFMISGTLFLNPNKPLVIKRLFTNNLLRIVTAFVFWSLVYTIYTHSCEPMSTARFILTFVEGNFHMWFLFAIFGLYLATPILRLICKDEKMLGYFLLFSFIFNILVYTILEVAVPLVDYIWLNLLTSVILSQLDRVGMEVVCGFSFYYVLGYYLSVRSFSQKMKVIIYIGALAGTMGMCILTWWASVATGAPYTGFLDEMSLTTMLQSVGIFLLIKNVKWKMSDKVQKTLRVLSKWSFGIYLVHELVIKTLEKWGFTLEICHPAISVPFVAVTVFVISMMISMILNQMPFFKKYII